MLTEYRASPVLHKNMSGKSGERKDVKSVKNSVHFIEQTIKHGKVKHSKCRTHPSLRKIIVDNSESKYASFNMAPEEAESGENRALTDKNKNKINSEEQKNVEHITHTCKHKKKCKQQQKVDHVALPPVHDKKFKEQNRNKYYASPNLHEIKLEEEQKAEDSASLNLYQMLPEQPKEFPVLAILHKTMPDKGKSNKNITLTNVYKKKYAKNPHNALSPQANNIITEEEKDSTHQNTPEKSKDAESPALLIEQHMMPDKLIDSTSTSSTVQKMLPEGIQEQSPEIGDSRILPKCPNASIKKRGKKRLQKKGSCKNNIEDKPVRIVESSEDKPVRIVESSEYYNYYQETKGKEYHTMYPYGKNKLPVGAILHLSIVTGNVTREDIKQALINLGANIAFIDYQMGNKEGWIRLKEEYTARIILKEITEGKIKIGESDVVFEVLKGKEQKKYLKKAVKDMYSFRTKVNSLSRSLHKHGFKSVKKIN